MIHTEGVTGWPTMRSRRALTPLEDKMCLLKAVPLCMAIIIGSCAGL